MTSAFKTLVKKPALGRFYHEVYEGLRVYPSGKDLIFYFATGTGTGKSIDIVRVLHTRMDIPSHL